MGVVGNEWLIWNVYDKTSLEYLFPRLIIMGCTHNGKGASRAVPLEWSSFFEIILDVR